MTRSPEEILDDLRPQGVQLGLDRPRRLLAHLGNPQRSLPAILVGGTNGKGSTAALLASMARAAGYRTGLYTSPPLEALEEVIQIDGRPVERQLLAEQLTRAVAAGAAHRELPTPFEALTAAAFLELASRQVELAVVEVGMGGARDVTNLTEPHVSLLTSVSLEHTAWLGDDLRTIAREKAGILRPNRPAFAAVAAPEAAEEVQRIAAEIGAHLTLLEDGATMSTETQPGDRRQTVSLETQTASYVLDLGLLGDHQVRNLALAVLAAEALGGLGWSRLDRAAIAEGTSACRWPGRLEEITGPGGRPILLDTAHNPEGVGALLAALEQRGEPFAVICGVLEDKDAASMVRPLALRARHVVLTRPPHPRGRDPLELARLVADVPGVQVEADPAVALDLALRRRGVVLVVCGSTYLVGEIRRRLAPPS